jgi:hypothetical protein
MNTVEKNYIFKDTTKLSDSKQGMRNKTQEPNSAIQVCFIPFPLSNEREIAFGSAT